MRKKSTTKENNASRLICKAPWRLTKVNSLPDYTLEVNFIDGTHGLVKMRDFIFSDEARVFSVLKNKEIFELVCIDHGVVTWPGEIDLAPDAMHHELKQNGIWQL